MPPPLPIVWCSFSKFLLLRNYPDCCQELIDLWRTLNRCLEGNQTSSSRYSGASSLLSWLWWVDQFETNSLQHPSVLYCEHWLYLQGILAFTFADYRQSTYGDYKYPLHADAIGFCIVALEIGVIPGVAIYKICTSEYEGSVMEVSASDNFAFCFYIRWSTDHNNDIDCSL